MRIGLGRLCNDLVLAALHSVKGEGEASPPRPRNEYALRRGCRSVVSRNRCLAARVGFYLRLRMSSSNTSKNKRRLIGSMYMGFAPEFRALILALFFRIKYKEPTPKEGLDPHRLWEAPLGPDGCARSD